MPVKGFRVESARVPASALSKGPGRHPVYSTFAPSAVQLCCVLLTTTNNCDGLCARFKGKGSGFLGCLNPQALTTSNPLTGSKRFCDKHRRLRQPLKQHLVFCWCLLLLHTPHTRRCDVLCCCWLGCAGGVGLHPVPSGSLRVQVSVCGFPGGVCVLQCAGGVVAAPGREVVVLVRVCGGN